MQERWTTHQRQKISLTILILFVSFRPTSTAFSNEFFTSAFESWKERLSEGELSVSMRLWKSESFHESS